MPSIILSNLSNYQALLNSEFSSYLISQRSSEVTQKNYIADLRNFFRWLLDAVETGVFHLRENSEKPLQAINVEAIEQYKRSQTTTHTPTATINRRLSALRMFFQLAQMQNWVTENPMLTIRNIPRTEAPNEISSLDDALTAFTKDLAVSDEEINDIKDFFGWYHTHFIS